MLNQWNTLKKVLVRIRRYWPTLIAAIVLAILGILNPVVGALVHNAGSVVVIINAAFLLQWKERSHKEGQ